MTAPNTNSKTTVRPPACMKEDEGSKPDKLFVQPISNVHFWLQILLLQIWAEASYRSETYMTIILG